jgi:tetratricopeptide (TPR) repeat protein
VSALDPAVRSHIDASDRALRANDRETALRHAREAVTLAPAHSDALRQLAAALIAFGPSSEAMDAIERAVTLRPNDAALLTTRAIVLEANGRPRDAIAAFRHADDVANHSTASLYNLGRALSKYASPEESLTVLDQVLQRDERHRGARATRAELLRQLGRIDETTVEYRRLLAMDPTDIKVWSALAAVDTKLDDAELAQLERIERETNSPEAKARVAFSLGRVYEKRARYPEAFGAFTRGNDVMRSQLPWNAPAFSAQVAAIRAAFDKPVKSSGTLGDGIIFIVSLPRSGSTLTEQMLAAHRKIDGGDERSDLFDVIAAESARRRLSFARWAPQATPDDWRRLGQMYLDRAAHWRSGKPFATDKMPMNWLWLGAVFAMLPAARVVECRRDRLECAWSCYAHVFNGGAQEFSYDIDSIAAYAKDYDGTMATWKAQYSARIHTQQYELLVEETEPQLRELLAFCGLEFDPACLRFHETQRVVRTASAAQVREPLRKDTARTSNYGALLDPLRAALGLSPRE